MLDTYFSIGSCQLWDDGVKLFVRAAGIQDDQPRVELSPHSEKAHVAITKQLQRVLDGVDNNINWAQVQDEIGPSPAYANW